MLDVGLEARYDLTYAPLAQLDRVLGFEPRGRRFESYRARGFRVPPIFSCYRGATFSRITPRARCGFDASQCQGIEKEEGPICAGKQASTTNSLAALYPKVACQWDKKKNGKLKASDVTPGSGRIVWWTRTQLEATNWKKSRIAI